MSDSMKDPDDMAMEKELDTILNLIDTIRAKHPTAEKPSPDGEPPWHRMGANAAEDGEGADGTIPCPACTGTVRYSISGYNGHIHAACSFPGCFVRWMQ